MRVCSLLALLPWMCGCEAAYPEVIVVNRTSDSLLMKQVSFSGCVWSAVLKKNQATSPGRCLPGTDRVHFQKYDSVTYLNDQLEAGNLVGLCPSDAGDTRLVAEQADAGTGADGTLVWFNYQTLSTVTVDYGDFRRIEVKLGDLEQDFSIPGPYGH